MAGAATAKPASILVLGGARSGKSHYAMACAQASPKKPVLIATATAGDAEMTARIARHRTERGPQWQVVEESLSLCRALRENASPETIVVVDCITFWLANLMFAGRDIEAEVQALADGLHALEGSCLLVSNEVGSGIVPDNAMARDFRDHQGRANQALAAACSSVVEVTAGLPRLLKPAPGLVLKL